MAPKTPLLLSNNEVFEYLTKNCDRYKLWEKIQFNTKIEFVTVKNKQGLIVFLFFWGGIFNFCLFLIDVDNHIWIVKWKKINHETNEVLEEGEDEFDGVMVCTGRHGSGGWIPPIPGLENFKKPYIHSSSYKYPEKHDLAGKTVLVIGK